MESLGEVFFPKSWTNDRCLDWIMERLEFRSLSQWCDISSRLAQQIEDVRGPDKPINPMLN